MLLALPDSMRTESDPHAVTALLAQLEQSLIDEYIRMRGHDPDTLSTLTEADRVALLSEASCYASGKLSEVEERLHFVHGLHDAIGDVPKAGKA
jgi:hypothetical protein